MTISNIIAQIANHGVDGPVNIGINTPSPYAGASVTGFIDGVSPMTASKAMAEFFNRHQFSAQYLIESAGIVYDPQNWGQGVAAIRAMSSGPAGGDLLGKYPNPTVHWGNAPASSIPVSAIANLCGAVGYCLPAAVQGGSNITVSAVSGGGVRIDSTVTTGPQGPQGAQGTPGAQGSQGPTGATTVSTLAPLGGNGTPGNPIGISDYAGLIHTIFNNVDCATLSAALTRCGYSQSSAATGSSVGGGDGGGPV